VYYDKHKIPIIRNAIKYHTFYQLSHTILTENILSKRWSNTNSHRKTRLDKALERLIYPALRVVAPTLKSTLKQSYGVSVSQMTMNMFRLLESQSGPFRINSLSPGWLQE